MCGGDGDFVTAYTSVNSRKMTFVRQREREREGKTSGDEARGIEEKDLFSRSREIVTVSNKSQLFRIGIKGARVDSRDYHRRLNLWSNRKMDER